MARPQMSYAGYERVGSAHSVKSGRPRSLLANLLLRVPWKPLLQRLPGVWLLCMVPFSFLAPVHFPALFAFWYAFLHLCFTANNFRSAYGVWVAYRSARASSHTDWHAKYCQATGATDGSDTTCHDLPYDHIQHVIILPNYKENMDTLCETLDVLASHSRALTQYTICLAMEETEGGAVEKAQALVNQYGDEFYNITYTIHPKGRPNEIRGKSSNVAWAAAQMAARGGGSHAHVASSAAAAPPRTNADAAPHLDLATPAAPGFSARHDHEILTVMDADTCFAEDYFNSVAYHYTTSTPEQRRIMMFAPSTVFDRNAKNVPVFVRVTDMFWAIGVMSNLYPGSAIKTPCSAYSVSMNLALSVGFWDAGAEAIGEDLHMYLKCFFATDGRVIVKSIYSPASQCNVEGEGDGMAGYVSGIRARYTQAKRHLWGSLDSGYAIRQAILAFCDSRDSSMLAASPTTADGSAPSAAALNAMDRPHRNHSDDAKASKDPKAKEATAATRSPLMGSMLLFHLFHRLFEAHILMGHLCMLIVASTIIVPESAASLLYPLQQRVWALLTGSALGAAPPVSPYVMFALNFGFWVRLISLPPQLTMIRFYEKYQNWVGRERWALQTKEMPLPSYATGAAARVAPSLPHLQRRVDSAKSLSDVMMGNDAKSMKQQQQQQQQSASYAADIDSADGTARVQYLGKRPQLCSLREYPRCLLDWAMIPFAGFAFYVAPQYHVHVAQLFTDSLEYKVAAKPSLDRHPPAHSLPAKTDMAAHVPLPGTPQLSMAAAAAPSHSHLPLHLQHHAAAAAPTPVMAAVSSASAASYYANDPQAAATAFSPPPPRPSAAASSVYAAHPPSGGSHPYLADASHPPHAYEGGAYMVETAPGNAVPRMLLALDAAGHAVPVSGAPSAAVAPRHSDSAAYVEYLVTPHHSMHAGYPASVAGHTHHHAAAAHHHAVAGLSGAGAKKTSNGSGAASMNLAHAHLPMSMNPINTMGMTYPSPPVSASTTASHALGAPQQHHPQHHQLMMMMAAAADEESDAKSIRSTASSKGDEGYFEEYFDDAASLSAASTVVPPGSAVTPHGHVVVMAPPPPPALAGKLAA